MWTGTITSKYFKDGNLYIEITYGNGKDSFVDTLTDRDSSVDITGIILARLDQLNAITEKEPSINLGAVSKAIDVEIISKDIL